MKFSQIKKILSIILFFILLSLSIVKCADILEYKASRIKYNDFFNSKTNFDVIFLGSSHMYNHILPMEIWKKYGISSYNWGYSNCTPAENYYIIQEILKYTNPKLVVIDSFGLIEYEEYGNGKYRTDRIEQQHVQFDNFPFWSKNKRIAINDIFDDYDNRQDFFCNFFMYHNRWTELKKTDFQYNISTEKGAEFLVGYKKGTVDLIDKTEKMEINSVCWPYYLDTLEYCQNQGIPVLCVYLPYGDPDPDSQKVANQLEETLVNYSEVEYINMLYLDIINADTDIYSDGNHLNYSGALKTSNWLGEYIKNNYLIDDYSNNQYWKEDYTKYSEYKKETLTSQTSLSVYLTLLSDDDFNAEAEIYNKKLPDNKVLLQLFDNANIEPKFIDSGSDECIRLIIRNSTNNEIIEDAQFYSSNIEKLDLKSLIKISSEELQ